MTNNVSNDPLSRILRGLGTLLGWLMLAVLVAMLVAWLSPVFDGSSTPYPADWEYDDRYLHSDDGKYGDFN